MSTLTQTLQFRVEQRLISAYISLGSVLCPPFESLKRLSIPCWYFPLSSLLLWVAHADIFNGVVQYWKEARVQITRSKYESLIQDDCRIVDWWRGYSTTICHFSPCSSKWRENSNIFLTQRTRTHRRVTLSGKRSCGRRWGRERRKIKHNIYVMLMKECLIYKRGNTLEYTIRMRFCHLCESHRHRLRQF